MAAAGEIIDRAERDAAYDRALQELDEFTGLDADEREELERSREIGVRRAMAMTIADAIYEAMSELGAALIQVMPVR
ncbi:MAG: hypothetical protein MZV49_12120 [Rhodopseudomonas palustris]|nr:hypothetical protein [Rhodopseudomonas palustris]